MSYVGVNQMNDNYMDELDPLTKTNWDKDSDITKLILFFAIKSGAIIQVGLLYFVVLIIFSGVIHKLLKGLLRTEEEYEKMPLWKISLELILHISCIILANYIGRKLVKKVPYIFDNIYGFKFSRLRELNGTILGATSIMLFIQTDLKEKIYYVVNRYKKIFNLK